MQPLDQNLPEYARVKRHYWDSITSQWIASGEWLWTSEAQ
mgnify:CR=1 FL=1